MIPPTIPDVTQGMMPQSGIIASLKQNSELTVIRLNVFTVLNLELVMCQPSDVRNLPLASVSAETHTQ